MFWILVSAIVTVSAVALAHRTESGETLWMKQALYLAAFSAMVFGGYNVYQWDAARSAPEEIEAHLPLYPGAAIKSRVPVEHFSLVESLFASEESGESIVGQWVYETSDSTMAVGKFYQSWVRRWRMPANVDLGMDYSRITVDNADYTMSVTARNHWGRTRITYTLMGSTG
jgi:hypothetical protein